MSSLDGCSRTYLFCIESCWKWGSSGVNTGPAVEPAVIIIVSADVLSGTNVWTLNLSHQQSEAEALGKIH